MKVFYTHGVNWHTTPAHAETVDTIYSVGSERGHLGDVARLKVPRVVAGQTFRWRAWIGDGWIDIPRRLDFLNTYCRLMNG